MESFSFKVLSHIKQWTRSCQTFYRSIFSFHIDFFWKLCIKSLSNNKIPFIIYSPHWRKKREKKVPETHLILLLWETESMSYHVQLSLQTTQGDMFTHISFNCLFISILENLLLDSSWQHACVSERHATETESLSKNSVLKLRVWSSPCPICTAFWLGWLRHLWAPLCFI